MIELQSSTQDMEWTQFVLKMDSAITIRQRTLCSWALINSRKQININKKLQHSVTNENKNK